MGFQNNKIFVTKPFLPPFEEFSKDLKIIWESRILTNSGPYHERFEKELAEYLGVKHVSLFSNGTLALITALQALNIAGEVITTPFSFVATTHSLWWNNIKPVFVDIEPGTFNLDADKIESAITPKTTAILPVHVYGNPCNLEKIQRIADTYGLKVIYDACHSFGVRIGNKSILKFGDLSVLSFHATKVFNTFEGGAIVSHSEVIKERIDFLKNFGHDGEISVIAPGINAKMNEFSAALGLLQLKYVNTAIGKRKKIAMLYRECFKNVKGLICLFDKKGVTHNYSYFPILVQSSFGASRDFVYDKLRKKNIFTRRYFYPLISTFPMYKALPSSNKDNLKTAEGISEEILCLPIYPDLNLNEAERIASEIISLKY